MTRVYNFSAGPAVLPEEVLQKAASELVEYNNTGMSVMEMSHRSKDYMDIIENTEFLLRELLNIPQNYKVLFLQGGASTQFSMIPINLKRSGRADFIHTGQWTKKAMAEAKKFLEVTCVASSEDRVFTYIPELTELSVDRDADYFFICSNNTIHGTRYASLPETGSVPLVADMSSSLLSEVIDVSRYGLIFAGAQKNIGPAGVTIVIIREDLVGHADDSIPTMMNYATHVENDSMFNTPPTYGIYIAGLVFQWLKEKGGLSAMEEINKKKAAILYDFLDESKLFRATVEKKDRSLMNVPFVSPTKELDEAFIKGAEGEGLMTLKGHRLAGGMRASIYNAMPVEGVEKLVAFMKKFEAENS